MRSRTLLPVQKNKALGVQLFSSWLPMSSTRNRLSKPGRRSSSPIGRVSGRERVGLCSRIFPMRQSGKIYSLNFHLALPDSVIDLESNATMASLTPKFIP
jgi:hypothetical protein